MRRHRRLLLSFVACVSIAVPRVALAGPSDECIAASEHAQELKNAGKLAAARDELVTCSRPECPKMVATDCTKWMGEVLAQLPSVIPAAKDPSGKDVIEARFSIDGKLATESLDGKAVAVDPGVHVFRLEANGMKPVEERVVTRVGEQNRVVSWKLEVGPAAPPPSTKTPPPEPESKKKIPVIPIVLGAAGVVLLGVSLFIDLKATGDAHDLRKRCAPDCEQDDVDAIQSRYVIAGVGAGLGAAALIGGAVLFFATRKSSDAGFAITPLLNGGAVAQGRITF